MPLCVDVVVVADECIAAVAAASFHDMHYGKLRAFRGSSFFLRGVYKRVASPRMMICDVHRYMCTRIHVCIVNSP